MASAAAGGAPWAMDEAENLRWYVTYVRARLIDTIMLAPSYCQYVASAGGQYVGPVASGVPRGDEGLTVTVTLDP